MKILPIADCRLPINGSFAGRRLARGRHDGSQGIGFFEQGGQFLCGYDFGFYQQFEPQGGFVGFFFDRADFGDEFRPAPRAARRTIIRGHRGSAANDLFGNDPAGIVIFGNSTGQFDNPQRKSFGAGFQFNWVHNLKLQIQSAIGNRQSAIIR
jgi:hypothetical protein